MMNIIDLIIRVGKRKLILFGSDVWFESLLFFELFSEFCFSFFGVFNFCILFFLWRCGIVVIDLCKEFLGYN